MTDTPHGPTTEELRARVLQHEIAEVGRELIAARPHAPAALLLTRPCLACNREPGERMCDLCQRLEEAEAGAS